MSIEVELWLFTLSALLLSLERICYVWAWRHTDSFVAFCESAPVALLGEPSAVLERFFYGFKLIQIGVFVAWCLAHGNGAPWPRDPGVAAVVGVAAIAFGQTLNLAVFHRLGRIGVFYGNRLGYHLPWVDGFPFSLVRHPQYVGAVLSIWGFFLVTRFPHEDWVVLPLLETAYYALGAHLES